MYKCLMASMLLVSAPAYATLPEEISCVDSSVENSPILFRISRDTDNCPSGEISAVSAYSQSSCYSMIIDRIGGRSGVRTNEATCMASGNEDHWELSCTMFDIIGTSILSVVSRGSFAAATVFFPSNPEGEIRARDYSGRCSL